MLAKESWQNSCHESLCQLSSLAVRPVSLSLQAREKVTTVPGWGPHRAICVHHGDRTGTGCCLPALQEQHPQLLGLSVMLFCVPCPHPVLASVPKKIPLDLSMLISRQCFPPELLGVEHMG